ncbi:MAG TPA: SRPBCC family protein [Bryobacteraceae bacterium]|nr:SRPBCC family protein [Bryobacteraceae bacterium]
MKPQFSLVLSAGAGAVMMYYLDPDRGRRRRAFVRDKLVKSLHKSAEFLDKATRDIANRARGSWTEAAEWVVGEPAPDDDVLRDRVRSRLGRLASHPSAIEVSVREGRVTLSGHILGSELRRVLSEVSSIHGVRGVDNRLEVHASPEGAPALQGPGSPKRGEVSELLHDQWTPALRLAAVAGGAALTGCGIARGGALGALLGFTGGAMFIRGASNCDLATLVGAGGKAITIQKTINIDAPVELVYDVWTHFEQFPRFMAHVREVRPLRSNRWRWCVKGPAGAPIQWDAEITRMEKNRVLAWKSVPGSVARNSGVITFRPNAQGGTQVDIRISYSPPLGEIGHAALSVAGADPRSMMHLDLVQLKSLIEERKTRQEGAAASRPNHGPAPIPAPADGGGPLPAGEPLTTAG